MAETGLGPRVQEGDYDGLVGVMGHLLSVKERQNTTDAMFEPLQQTIALLKLYEQELPDVVHKQLEVRILCNFSHFTFIFSSTQSRLLRHIALPPGNSSSVTSATSFLFLSSSTSPSLKSVCRSCQKSGPT